MILLLFPAALIFLAGVIVGFGFAAWVVGGELSRGWNKDEPLPFGGGTYADEEVIGEIGDPLWDRYLDGDR